jgi:hypothetical protein
VINGTGGGSFKTQWSYNSADLVSTMRYPSNASSGLGETVTYEYLKQMLVDSVIGTDTYVQGTTYSAAGRLNVRTLGANELLTDYNYFAWTAANGWGRLKEIKSGTPSDTDSLQDLGYTYDAVGNVLTIKDYLAGSPQTQTFTYDALSQLYSAEASGGSGGTYSKQYYYYSTTTGNLSSKVSKNYYYDSTQKHAVRRVSDTGGTSKSITIRAKGSICNGGWPIMLLRVNNTDIQQWTVNTSVYTNYTASAVLSGNDQFEVVFTNDCNNPSEDRNLYVDYVIVDGQTVQAEGDSTIIDKGSGDAAYDGQNVVLGQTNIFWAGALRFVIGNYAFAGGYDANGNLTSRVVDGAAFLFDYDEENHLTGVSGAATATFVYDGDGNRVKGTVGGVTTVYIGSHFEWMVQEKALAPLRSHVGSTSTMIKYYYESWYPRCHARGQLDGARKITCTTAKPCALLPAN